MNFYIQRDDGMWYAGTADFQPVWTKNKEHAAPFSSREQAGARIEGLPDDKEYTIER